MLAMAATFVPLPLLAADTAAATPVQPVKMSIAAQPLKMSIAAHAKREVLVSSSTSSTSSGSTAKRSAQNGSNDPKEPGFFRSPAGIACLAVLAAGTGFAIYSASHDRVHSVVRQGQ